ncbi:MAG: hypothetical protein A2020_09515 [Lentisphaerae bacterium GWF2_45_14]|nr:MAG: hypothetical protein A2020_09515 [Lentisphaerae bacterium GWF2_45_14]
MNITKVRKPNLLFVFSDQHRFYDIGYSGNREVSTPNLDNLASNGVTFSNCISNSPLCVPARGSLLTGLLPLNHKAITNDLPIVPETESIANVLNEHGYKSGYIGKWHLDGVPRDKAIPPERRLGFNQWKAYNCNHNYMNNFYYDKESMRFDSKIYEPELQTDLAMDFIEKERNDPWCLFVSWGPPHDPYMQVPEKYLEQYENKTITLRPNVPEKIMDKTNKYLDCNQIEKNMRGYYAHISALDEQMGRLSKKLSDLNLLEDTIIVYTSDHGDMLGSHGFTNKQLPYDEAVRVPLIVSWKGKTPKSSSNEMIGLVDLPVSLLELTGCGFGSARDGMDLHNLFLKKGAEGRKECFIMDIVPCHQAADRGGEEWRGIRTKKYTYARDAAFKNVMLFDDENDPYQLRNLASDGKFKNLREELETCLQKELASSKDSFLPWPEMIIKGGYLTDWNKSQRFFNRPVLSQEK